MKLVINKCYGGFSLSDAAYEKLIEWGVPLCSAEEAENKPEAIARFDRPLLGSYWDTGITDNRAHPLLIRVVEELGEEAASGPLSELKLIEIPDGVEYTIEEYDGQEWIAEKHQTWG